MAGYHIKKKVSQRFPDVLVYATGIIPICELTKIVGRDIISASSGSFWSGYAHDFENELNARQRPATTLVLQQKGESIDAYIFDGRLCRSCR